jgi:UDP:flavonoid glycosyltransferase YjiC (YdhE family)
VMMALYTGVPIVAVPQMPEAVLLTQRAAALGLGTVVPQQDMTGDRLCSAVAGLLGNAKVREKAARMRDQTQSAGGAPAAASVLEQRFLTV